MEKIHENVHVSGKFSCLKGGTKWRKYMKTCMYQLNFHV